MEKILVISGSISAPEASNSWKAYEKFISYYKNEHPDDEITILDLNHEPMANKNLNRENFSNGFFTEEDSQKYIDQLKNVDKVVMVTPMINFMPSPLIRNYFDHVLVANKTFSYKYAEKGKSKGLLDHLKVELIIAQGSPTDWYTFTRLAEFLTGLWNFAGANVNGVIMVDGTKTEKYSADGGAEAFLAKIDDQIKKDAKKF